MRYSKSGHHLSQVNTAIARATFGIAHLLPAAAPAGQRRADAGVSAITTAGAVPITAESSPASANGITAKGMTCRAPDPCPVEIALAIAFDCEASRIAFGLKETHHLQRYLPLHEEARQTGRQGFTFAEFDALLVRYGVQGCAAYNRRLLKQGDGKYWRIDYRAGKVYPFGFVALSKRLIQAAHDAGLNNLYETNIPGERRAMYLNVAGTAADFESSIINAWIASRNNPTISLTVLRQLFNRDARTLRVIIARAGIETVKNIANTTDPVIIPLKPNGELRSDVYRTIENNQTVFHFRLPNTYISKPCRQHDKLGQGRRAEYSIERWIGSNELLGKGAAGDNIPEKLKQVGRLYCENDDTADRSQRWGNVNTVFVPRGAGRGGAIGWDVHISTMYKTI